MIAAAPRTTRDARRDSVRVRSAGSPAVSTRVEVGKPTFPSPDELYTYMDREDAAFQSLAGDMYRRLVYDDPDALRARAKFFRDLAADPPGEVLGMDSAQVKKYVDAQNAAAATLESDANTLDARIGKVPAKVALEQQVWSRAYRDFLDRWKTFYDETKGQGFLDPFSVKINSEWNQTNAFDAEYRQDYKLFQDKFGKPSRPLPPTPEDIEASHGDTPFPWTLAIVVAGVAGVALIVWKVL